ncbi:MAG TPA: DUF4124 domain-containing protein [Verrucomicrobiae bacterium]|nr:DUF4124 domain-containing protein [Verrucomicrobiae bacterium]
MRILIALLCLALATYAVAKEPVYKWVDDKGVVHYTDKPPTDNARPAQLPPLQTYKGNKPPTDLQRFDKGNQAGKQAGIAQIDVVTPARDETFRSGERTVPVAVMVTPPLAEGQRLIYLLDGTPQSTPTPDTSFALTNVERGSHTVSVTLVDDAGNALANSSGITFHMKPPTAR